MKKITIKDEREFETQVTNNHIYGSRYEGPGDYAIIEDYILEGRIYPDDTISIVRVETAIGALLRYRDMLHEKAMMYEAKAKKLEGK